MEFDINRVYTAKDADKVKVGSKVVLANSMKDLREKVEFAERCTVSLSYVDPDDYLKRFVSGGDNFGLCYLISEPENKVLRWCVLKLGDVIKRKDGQYKYMVTGIRQNGGIQNIHIEAGCCTISDAELKNWEKVEE